MKVNKIYKPKKFNKFTIVPNAIFRYKGISATATGLYCWLFSHSDDAEICIKFICGHFKEGKDAINKRIKELSDIGFLVREEVRNKGKFAGYNYYLNDKPKSTANGKTAAGKTAAEKPAPVNPQQSNTNNITINKEIINKNIDEKIKTPKYNDEIMKAFPFFVDLFPDQYKPKTKSQINRWLDCLDKIVRIDKYTLKEVYIVSKDLRNDQFWQKNFLSILKFRNTDKNGIKYIDRFMLQYKSENKPPAYYKIKGIIDYFIYESPIDGTKEIGANTNSGKIHEFNIKQVLQSNEFIELKKYILNGNK